MPQTYNLIVNTNFDTLMGPTLLGTDIYNINGAVLTIDTDTRYCSNRYNITGNLGSTATAVNISTSLGGQLKIDGNNCEMIQYYGGSGTLQAIGADVGLFATVMTWTGGTATITTGSIAVASCTWVINSTAVSTTGNFLTAGVVPGMLVIAAGIAANTYVQSVTDALNLVLTQNSTASGSAILMTFNVATAPTYVNGQIVTIANSYPPTWNGTYTITAVSAGIYTVPIANDPGTIVQRGTSTRKFIVSQALTKTPASAGSYVITGSGPYTITVALPNHNFATGNSIIVAGSTSSGTTMNGTWTATRINNDSFSFSMPTSPVSVSVAGTITKTVKAEQLSIWAAISATSTGLTVAATGSGYTATVTVTHAFQPGDFVTFAGYTPAALNGTYAVETITGTTAFTYFRNDTQTISVHGKVACPSRQLTLAAGGTPTTAINAIGFLKIKNVVNGPFERGTLTLEGGTSPVMTASSAETPAPIEVVGCDTGVVNIPRQGKFISQGSWFYQPQCALFTQSVTAAGSAGAWTVTVTTAAYFGGAAQVHRLYVGQEVILNGIIQGEYNGTFRIISCPTATTFTILNTSLVSLTSASTQGSIIPTLCTTGVALQQYILPISGATAIGGVWIEKYPGADIGTGANSAYDFYPNQGTNATASVVGTDAARGKVCWITTSTGVFRIGADASLQVKGFLPPPGCKIRYGNIFTVGVTAGTPGTNTLMGTLSTRFKFLTTSAGYISIDKTHMYWQPTFVQPYYVSLTNTTVADQILASEIAAVLTWDNVHVAPSAVLATTIGLSLGTCFASGSTISNSSFTSAQTVATSTSTGSTPCGLTDIDGFTFTDCNFRSVFMGAFNTTAAASKATPYPSCAIYGLNLTNCTFTNPKVYGAGKILLVAGANNVINNLKYSWNNATAFNSTVALSSIILELSTKGKGITLNGLDWNNISCISMSCTTNVVTVTTDIPHGFATSTVVDIGDALDPTYNAHSVTISLVARTTTNCTTVIGDNSVTTTSSYTTSGVLVGDIVTGTGVPVNTYVESIQSATVLKLTNACTAAGAVTLTFNPLNQFTYPITAPNIGTTAQTSMTVAQANVNQPITSIIANNNCDDIKIRNIGTYYSKLNLGTNSTTTYPAYLYNGAVGISGLNVELKRIYVSPTRTAIINAVNSLSKLNVESVHAMIPFEMTTAPTSFTAQKVTISNLSSIYKGCSWYHTVPTTSTGISVYGSHWFDTHVSINDSQIHILGNESSAITTSQAVENLSNSAQSGFNSVGAFVMPNVNDSIIWTSPYNILGHNGFCSTPAGLMTTATVGTATVPGVAATLTITASSWAAVTINVNTHTNTIVDGIANTDVLYVGCPVSGSGFQSNTIIVSINSSSAITISLPTTSTLSATAMTYSGEISFTAGTHRLAVGDTVMIAGTVVTASTWYGVYSVSGITSTTVFRVKCTINPGGTAPTAGTVTVPYIAVSNMAYATNVLTVTTSFAHGFLPGDTVIITDALYTAGTVLLNNCNGKYVVTSVPSITTFTIAVAGSPGTTPTASTGSIRPDNNIELTYDVNTSGSWRSMRMPIMVCSTTSTGDGVVYTADTSNVAVGDWVYGNNIATGGAKVTAINPNVSFTLGRNNVVIAGGTSTTITSFTCYASRMPGEVLPTSSTGFVFNVKALNYLKNSVAQITNITAFTASTRTSQSYQYPLDLYPITLTNLVVGSKYRIDNVTTGYTLVTSGAASTSTITGSFAVNIGDTLRIRVRKTSAAPKYLDYESNTVVTSSGASMLISQTLDSIIT